MKTIPLEQTEPIYCVVYDSVQDILPSGSTVTVGKVEDKDLLRVDLTRMIDEQTQSEHTFCISNDAARSLALLILDRLGVIDARTGEILIDKD
jgi:hypothetical protein